MSIDAGNIARRASSSFFVEGARGSAPGAPEWLYHGTSVHAARSIARDGLLHAGPPWSDEESFWETFGPAGVASYWTSHAAFAEAEFVDGGVLLRTRMPPDAYLIYPSDEADEWLIPRDVAAAQIEVRVGRARTWLPLIEAVRQRKLPRKS